MLLNLYPPSVSVYCHCCPCFSKVHPQVSFPALFVKCERSLLQSLLSKRQTSVSSLFVIIFIGAMKHCANEVYSCVECRAQPFFLPSLCEMFLQNDLQGMWIGQRYLIAAGIVRPRSENVQAHVSWPVCELATASWLSKPAAKEKTRFYFIFSSRGASHGSISYLPNKTMPSCLQRLSLRCL